MVTQTQPVVSSRLSGTVTGTEGEYTLQVSKGSEIIAVFRGGLSIGLKSFSLVPVKDFVTASLTGQPLIHLSEGNGTYIASGKKIIYQLIEGMTPEGWFKVIPSIVQSDPSRTSIISTRPTTRPTSRMQEVPVETQRVHVNNRIVDEYLAIRQSAPKVGRLNVLDVMIIMALLGAIAFAGLVLWLSYGSQISAIITSNSAVNNVVKVMGEISFTGNKPSFLNENGSFMPEFGLKLSDQPQVWQKDTNFDEWLKGTATSSDGSEISKKAALAQSICIASSLGGNQDCMAVVTKAIEDSVGKSYLMLPAWRDNAPQATPVGFVMPGEFDKTPTVLPSVQSNNQPGGGFVAVSGNGRLTSQESNTPAPTASPQLVPTSTPTPTPTSLSSEKQQVYDLLVQKMGKDYAWNAINGGQQGYYAVLESVTIPELTQKNGLGEVAWALEPYGFRIFQTTDGQYAAKGLTPNANGEVLGIALIKGGVQLTFSKDNYLMVWKTPYILAATPSYSENGLKFRNNGNWLFEVPMSQVWVRDVEIPGYKEEIIAEQNSSGIILVPTPTPYTININDLGMWLSQHGRTQLTTSCPAEPLHNQVVTAEDVTVVFGLDAAAQTYYSQAECQKVGGMVFTTVDHTNQEGWIDYMGSGYHVWVYPFLKPKYYPPTPTLQPGVTPTATRNPEILYQPNDPAFVALVEANGYYESAKDWDGNLSKVKFDAYGGPIYVDLSCVAGLWVTDYPLSPYVAIKSKTSTFYMHGLTWHEVYGLLVAPFR